MVQTVTEIILSKSKLIDIVGRMVSLMINDNPIKSRPIQYYHIPPFITTVLRYLFFF